MSEPKQPDAQQLLDDFGKAAAQFINSAEMRELSRLIVETGAKMHNTLAEALAQLPTDSPFHVSLDNNPHP